MSPMQILIIILAFISYFALHSLLAGAWPKNTASRLLGERLVNGFYRVFYNFFAMLSLLPVVLLLMNTAVRQIYEVNGLLVLIFRIFQVMGIAGVGISLLYTDVLSFIGITQAVAYLAGRSEEVKSAILQVNGPYRYVRHPLYLSSLLVIWFSPRMTDLQLLTNICITLYVIIGSKIEEVRMRKIFGQAYHDYQMKVPALLPLRRKNM